MVVAGFAAPFAPSTRRFLAGRASVVVDEAESIGMLLADYEHQWLVARAELRDAVAQADPSEAVPMGALPLIVTFRNQQTSLSDRLAADMAFLLPDGSEERWLDLQNEIWRRRRLPRGHLAGENVDIWAILIPIEQDFGLHRSEQTEALLQEWEERVAELLTMREPYDLEGPTQFRNLVMEGDLEAGYQYLADWVQIRQSLRNHTKSTAEAIMEKLPPMSLIVNATGMGKDLPGSPIPNSSNFPDHAIVWELNYRGSLEFYRHAQDQQKRRKMRVHDGWDYFLLGWSSVMEEVFHFELTESLMRQLKQTAKPLRNE